MAAGPSTRRSLSEQHQETTQGRDSSTRGREGRFAGARWSRPVSAAGYWPPRRWQHEGRRTDSLPPALRQPAEPMVLLAQRGVSRDLRPTLHDLQLDPLHTLVLGL